MATVEAGDDPVLIASMMKAAKYVPDTFSHHPSQAEGDEGEMVCS